MAAAAPTIRDGIYELLQSVEIDTKEEGRARVQPWLSQRMVIDTIASGMAEDVHEYCVLKSRQVAITTCCSVIELFWALANPGTQACIVADRTDNLERLRRIFAALLETLPPQWRGPQHRLKQNNRNGMSFRNNSVIDLLAAAGNPDLGASRAINLLHATECGLWRSVEGVESLRAALAQTNPNRLYMYESTANGFNWWYDLCMRAKEDRRMRFIFCGFWSNPNYQIPRTDPDYRVYWDGRLDEEELKRARYVKQNYNYTVTPEQIAWWRREAEHTTEEMMLRNYPFTEVECFTSSGSGFFPAHRTLELHRQLATPPPYKGYRYIFDEKFLSSRIEQVFDSDQVMLRVWEHPQNEIIPGGRREDGYWPDKPAGVYAIGCDPSGGGGNEADDHAIEIFRAYGDLLVQVAEFQTNQPLTYQIAWVLAHLCGAYRTHTAINEVTGIGSAIPAEIRNLRQLAQLGLLASDPGAPPILDVIGQVRWFLYKRADTYGGAGSVHSWKTNQDNKAWIYTSFRDSLSLHRVVIQSRHLVDQLQGIVTDDGWIGAGEDSKKGDDLVQAAVMAHHAWTEWQREPLLAQGVTWDAVNLELPPPDVSQTLNMAFQRHFKNINEQARRRYEKF